MKHTDRNEMLDAKYSYFRNCVCDNGKEIFENRVMIRTEISHITELIWLGTLLLATLVPYPSLRKAPNDRPHRLLTTATPAGSRSGHVPGARSMIISL